MTTNVRRESLVESREFGVQGLIKTVTLNLFQGLIYLNTMMLK